MLSRSRVTCLKVRDMPTTGAPHRRSCRVSTCTHRESTRSVSAITPSVHSAMYFLVDFLSQCSDGRNTLFLPVDSMLASFAKSVHCLTVDQMKIIVVLSLSAQIRPLDTVTMGQSDFRVTWGRGNIWLGSVQIPDLDDRLATSNNLRQVDVSAANRETFIAGGTN